MGTVGITTDPIMAMGTVGITTDPIMGTVGITIVGGNPASALSSPSKLTEVSEMT
jgi:hypothetical protein